MEYAVGAEDFVNHLSEKVTIGRISLRITKICFYNASFLIECIRLVKWPEMERRVRRAMGRYHGQVVMISVTLNGHVGPANIHSGSVVMQDGAVFHDCAMRLGVSTTQFDVYGSVQPGPCLSTATDLDGAIAVSDLPLVEEVVKSGVDVNSHGPGGPMLLTAVMALNASLGVRPIGPALCILNWLACRPEIRWNEVYRHTDGHMTTVSLEALEAEVGIIKLLPWHTIDTHLPIANGNNLLLLYLTKTGPIHVSLERVKLLLSHGSGTLVLYANDAGICACDMFVPDLSIGVELWRAGREAAEAVRVLLLRCIGVRALVALVFGYYTPFL